MGKFPLSVTSRASSSVKQTSRVAPPRGSRLPAIDSDEDQSSPLLALRLPFWWIIFTVAPHHPLPAVPGWQLLAVANETTPPDWSHPGAVLLMLID
ncbi:Os05g0204750 [Oryza sativa Japonica Group]|uniref:Os05g0204750 protein n=1 Tax=Oryza sativa subsp. japonica TaxID=39947 RepID=A0A0P0WJ58_ORYSJ|nr:Os05g0204750 [Oryza sativa Japonica Group]